MHERGHITPGTASYHHPYTSASFTHSYTHEFTPEAVREANILISSFFKTLIDHEVTVELKNDIQIRGILKSVDQYLNIKLENIQVVEEIKYPHMVRPPRPDPNTFHAFPVDGGFAGRGGVVSLK
jgi:small nuclear ribonucleoprotein (snRNP)-like protein